MSFEPKQESGQKPDQELKQFVYRFLKIHGAELEKNSNGFESLLPENLARLLETPEYLHINMGLSAGSDLKPDSDDVYSIDYGSKLLEKMVNTACSQVPLLACRLKFDYLKSQGFDRLIKDQLNFNGSVGNVESWAKIKTTYLFLTCSYIAQSDEQKEGLVKLTFNLETGAYIPEMVSMLSFTARDYKTDMKAAILDDDQINKIMKWVKRQTKEAISEETGQFQESMTRRFKRDVLNLEEYYACLKKEMELSLERTGLSNQLIKERKGKIALLPDELARKKDDLFKKYSIKVKVKLCSAMLIITPAIKILYRTSIGGKNKNLSLIYNPVTKSMDPPVCQGCGSSATSVYFCDHLHLLCPLCNKSCPVCQLL